MIQIRERKNKERETKENKKRKTKKQSGFGLYIRALFQLANEREKKKERDNKEKRENKRKRNGEKHNTRKKKKERNERNGRRKQRDYWIVCRWVYTKRSENENGWKRDWKGDRLSLILKALASEPDRPTCFFFVTTIQSPIRSKCVLSFEQAIAKPFFFFPIPFRLTRCVEKRKSTENKFDEIKKKWRKVRGGFMWIFSNPSDTLWYALVFIAFCGRNACSRYRSCENNRIYESHSLLNGRQKSECPAECGVDGSRIT